MNTRMLIFIPLVIIICSIGCGGKKEIKDTLAPNLEEIEPNNKQSQAVTVSHGTIVKGFINEKMDQDWYKITIPEDSSAILKAELTGIEDINLKMELFDVDKELLLEVNRYKEGEGETLTNYLLKPGEIFIRVRELWLKNKEKKFNDTTAYNLRIYLSKLTPDVELEPNNKAINATPIIPDSSMKGFISPYNDIDWYRLTLIQQNNKYLEIVLSALENVDVKLKVYDPIEALIEEANKGGKGEGEKITNLGVDPAKEFYYIVVEGGSWQTNEISSYQLSARFVQAVNKIEFEPNDRLVKATEIADGDSIFGFIDDGKDVDWYHIKRDATESQIARIEVKGIPKIDFKLSLANELEESLLSVNETGEQESERITNFGLMGSEDYYFKLESVKNGANDADQYSVFIKLNSYFGTEEFELNNQKETANPIEIEKAMAGYIHPVGDVDFYRLELPNRYYGKLEIILEGIMKVNTDMILYDDSMNEIATAAAKLEEGIERIIFDAYPGIYYIKVYDNDGKESNYRDKYKIAIFIKQT